MLLQATQFEAIWSSRNRKRMHRGYALQPVGLPSNPTPPCVFFFTPSQRRRAAKTKVKSSRSSGPYILISCKASREVLCLCRTTPRPTVSQKQPWLLLFQIHYDNGSIATEVKHTCSEGCQHTVCLNVMMCVR